MNSASIWYKASDGTPAVDMQVALVTGWSRVGNKDRPSYQSSWPAGPVGTFSIDFSNDPVAGGDPAVAAVAANCASTGYPAAAFSSAPTQPTGTADNNILAVDAVGEFSRERYTPTPGQTAAGAGKLPTTNMALQPGELD